MARRSEPPEDPAQPDAQATAKQGARSSPSADKPRQKSPRPAEAQPKAERNSAPAPRGVPTGPETEPSPWWLRRSDQAVLAVLCAVCLVLMGWYLVRLSGWGRRPIEIRNLPQREVDYRIDINRASWVEFAQLPRIGRVLAERLVEDRERNGPFESIEDLQRVRGIGAKTIERMRPFLKPFAQEGSETGEPEDAQAVPGNGQIGVQ